MGASNVAAAYQLCAGKVPPIAMQVLAYMALVSKDSDERPWFGQGHMALAVHALGRTVECRCGQSRCRCVRQHEEAVRRAVKPLRDIGVVTVDRAPSRRRADGPKTIRYRLHLTPPAEVVPFGDASQRPTESVANAPRNPCQRPTESVSTPHGIRRAEEYEENEERGEEEGVTSSTQVPTAREDIQPQTITLQQGEKQDAKPLADECAACGAYLDPDGSCFACRPLRSVS